ncbi:hypothetical protein [Microbispora sp. KK1-11]|uniref:hypothetical protein n=1 Tax=Microbispora sp. KK1-11 TaxID=2053005 RepID=UPI00115A95FC|nr:hypothetical protein [Microbispora sp. KK1-11]TQS19862.1 hypothetical protein FLW16_41300 [Microbispora sp. KK1-11]
MSGALRAMLAILDRTTLAGQRDAALLLLGYATAARAGELVALDLADVTETGEGLDVVVYRPKLKRYTQVAVPYGRNPATCPVRAARAYRAGLAGAGRTTGPLHRGRADRHLDPRLIGKTGSTRRGVGRTSTTERRPPAGSRGFR